MASCQIAEPRNVGHGIVPRDTHDGVGFILGETGIAPIAPVSPAGSIILIGPSVVGDLIVRCLDKSPKFPTRHREASNGKRLGDRHLPLGFHTLKPGIPRLKPRAPRITPFGFRRAHRVRAGWNDHHLRRKRMFLKDGANRQRVGGKDIGVHRRPNLIESAAQMSRRLYARSSC